MSRMECGEVRDLLASFEDGELIVEERAAVAAHLEGCERCRAAHAELRTLSRRIRGAGTFAMPPGLEQKVSAAIAEDARRPALPRPWRLLAVAASYALVALLSAALGYLIASRTDARQAAIRDVVTAHTRSLINEPLVQVASADTHTVRPWFMGKVPFAPAFADLSNLDFPLIGGRVDFVFERPVAAVVYGRRKHRINVFVMPADQIPLSLAAGLTNSRNGYNVIGWEHAGFGYVAASDLNAAELQQLADALRNPAK